MSDLVRPTPPLIRLIACCFAPPRPFRDIISPCSSCTSCVSTLLDAHKAVTGDVIGSGVKMATLRGTEEQNRSQTSPPDSVNLTFQQRLRRRKEKKGLPVPTVDSEPDEVFDEGRDDEG